MAIVIVIVAITASVVTWVVASKQKTVSQDEVIAKPTTQTLATESQQTSAKAGQESVVYKNTGIGNFKLTMPKEWSEYLAYDTMLDGNYGTVKFFLPTKDSNWPNSLIGNDIKYAYIMTVEIWDINYWNEKKNAAACKNDPIECPGNPYIKGDKYAYVIFGGQDAPSDLQDEPYMIGLNFPENFNKYFKFELLPAQ